MMFLLEDFGTEELPVSQLRAQCQKLTLDIWVIRQRRNDLLGFSHAAEQSMVKKLQR